MTHGEIEILRALRAWHYRQAVDFRLKAQDIDRRPIRNEAARRAYEGASSQFHAKANEHIRFVQQLNEFFPATDRVM
jgi:hypothetical protein